MATTFFFGACRVSIKFHSSDRNCFKKASFRLEQLGQETWPAKVEEPEAGETDQVKTWGCETCWDNILGFQKRTPQK